MRLPTDDIECAERCGKGIEMEDKQMRRKKRWVKRHHSLVKSHEVLVMVK